MIALTFALAAATSAFVWTDDGSRLTLTEGGRPVLGYNYAMRLDNGAPELKRRQGYIHPLYSPNGAVVTDDFPRDHWHHRGVFWAWADVRFQGVKRDMWTLTGGVQSRFEKFLEKDAAKPVLAVQNAWFFGEQRVATETVRFSVEPLKGSERKIHFDITLEGVVAEPVEVAGIADQRKGYGGFSMRFAPRENTIVRTDKGTEAKDTDMVPHPWAELEATYGGKRAAVRIDDDKSNPGYPNGWCLRNYGFLGVNYPGLTTIRLEKGKPVHLKYTVSVRSIE